MAPREMEPGAVIGCKYRLSHKLASGGSGVVWVARHLTLDIDVAVKLLPPERLDPSRIERFRREARAVARLTGAHVVRLHDYGLEEGRPYMVMELLEGEDLRARLKRCGALSLAEAARIVRQIGAALRSAHALGLVHRDLKPGNVFLADVAGEETVKVLDFGIAKDVHADPGEKVTVTGTILGTPAYMAPEQARGEDIDARSDLWALAVILLELVIGANPFRGDDVIDTLARIAWEPLPVPSRLDPRLGETFDAFMAQALQRARAGRFASVDAFLVALDDTLDGATDSLQRSTTRPVAGASTIGREDETLELDPLSVPTRVWRAR